MRSLIAILLITLFVLVTDLYTFRGIQHLAGMEFSGHRIYTLIFWGISLLVYTAVLWAGSQFRQLRDPSRFSGIMLVMGIFLMIYLPKLLFCAAQLAGDVTVLLARLFHAHADTLRIYFLRAGVATGGLLMFAFGMGMIRGKTNVKVYRKEIPVIQLPAGLEGLKIVQISDIHLAGFYHQQGYIRELVERINGLGPELLVFTGDMVNNFSEETDPFTGILDQLEAPLGKFAILGNHDYGHYFAWGSEAEKRANLERLKQQIRASGFDLLLNEHRKIERNGSILEIVGVENWGKPPFPQYGDLEAAMLGNDPDHFKVLLSHDPSHWDLKIRGKQPVALTLSGHTHAMQFGIELGRFRWSPSKWTYRHWAGLYREGDQFLYVNRGLGFIGYPGRVGIRPEITLLTLTRG